MASNNLRVLEIEAKHLSTNASNKLVACAVETILTNTILLVVLIRHRVHIVDSGDSVVERGIENSYLLDTRQHLLHREDTLKVCGVVQGSDRVQRLNLSLNLIINQAAIVEELTTMSHTMTSSLKLVKRLDNTVLGVCQGVENKTNTCCVVGNRTVQLELILTLRLVS